MTIKKKLLLMTFLPILLAGTISIVLVLNHRRQLAVQERAKAANNIVKQVFELNMLANEFIRHPGERTTTQWWLRHASLSRLVRALDSPNPRGLDNLEGVFERASNIAALFRQLSTSHEGGGNPITREFEQHLTGQLLERSHSLVERATAFAAASEAEADRIGRRSRLLVTGLAIVAAVLMVIVSFLVSRNVLRPIEVLHKGTEIIGTGDLDHTIEYSAKDEIGELAVAFNAMTGALRQSKGELEELNRELERRVQRRTAQLERSNANLERSNIELQQFAYVASHDLKEPLRMVSSYCQLLERRYKGRLDEEADTFIHFAVDGAHRMAVLINDLLAYSRVETRSQSFESIDCEKVLEIAETNLKSSIEESSTTVTHDPLPRVMGDGSQLMQVFQNLIGNAIKFRRDESPEVHVSARQDGREWTFCVRDNGIGIDHEHRDRIFQIFKRLHNREKYPGTGIGLAVCRKVVERHGGRIWVESETDQGSSFYFSMPISGAAAS